MSEEQQEVTPEVTAETESAEAATPEVPEVTAIDAKEIEEGKAFAILSYVLGFLGLPFFLIPLIMRNNTYSLYHAKQCLMIWLVGMAGGMISSVLVAVFCLGVITGMALGVFILVVEILGIINAVNGEMKPLPVIGKYADEWFKGITKTNA
jgi:uncharacterized membrane protein